MEDEHRPGEAPYLELCANARCHAVPVPRAPFDTAAHNAAGRRGRRRAHTQDPEPRPHRETDTAPTAHLTGTPVLEIWPPSPRSHLVPAPAGLADVGPSCLCSSNRGWLPYLGLHFVTVLRVAHLDVLAIYALEDVQNVPDKGCLGHFPNT